MASNYQQKTSSSTNSLDLTELPDKDFSDIESLAASSSWSSESELDEDDSTSTYFP